MIEETQAHKTSTFVIGAADLAVVDACADMALKVWISCSSACDLRGTMVKLITQEGVEVKAIEITEYDGTDNETGEFVVKAPLEPGDYTWTAVFPAQDKDGIQHKEDSEPFPFTVRSHATSMAVWDVPSPIVLGATFSLKVGVKCAAQCGLGGREIEIHDHEGVKVTTGTLADAPWPNATALYWTEVELKAPGTEGLYKWTATFPEPELALSHLGTAYPFVYRVVTPPEYVVTVEVLDLDTGGPVEKADVLLHPYRGQTGADGLARIGVAAGEYELAVTKGNIGAFQKTVKVAGDMTLKVNILNIPPLPYDGGS